MEESLPKIVTDLALILIVAGVVTIVFKRLKQPLVLGYIVAGFLAGPNMPYMPTVEDATNVDVWSQIGVVFLMFSLGLEFSFKKIIRLGFGPVLSACCIMMSMIGVGCGVGSLMGWSTINCMFLGGILSMSSTTIIYKAFDDLGLSTKQFAGRVLSVLILEDILGILVMVVLSALAVSSKFEGTEMLMSLFKLGFFLLLWFLVGVWVVPSFLKRNKLFINNETLLIVSLGLCFLMVVIADRVGYSSAFGAFMMGSILAETLEAEQIEHTVAPVKDLFGAIFFVSVGMMVSPQILADYWLSILILVVSVVVGQMIFGTFGYLLSGLSLKDAIQSGFSMCQIGEFAFIIAGMGISLHVTDGFLYPVVVAVSIITTFLTPYMIKAAPPTYNLINRIFVHKEAKDVDKKKEKKENKSLLSLDNEVTQNWIKLLKGILFNVCAYGTMCVAVLAILFVSYLVICRQIFGHWTGNAVCGVSTLMVLSLFLRPIVMKKNHSIEATYLVKRGVVHGIFLIFLMLLRFTFACTIIYYVLNFLSPYHWYYHIAASILIMIFFIRLRVVKYLSVMIERRFVQNLSRRDVVMARKNEKKDSLFYARRLRGRDLHIVRLEVPKRSVWAGRTLAQLNITGTTQSHIVAIVRGGERINIPGGNRMLYPGDIIEVLGDDDSIEMLQQKMSASVMEESESKHDELQLLRIVVPQDSSLIGLMIKKSGIRDRYHCMVVGFEDTEGELTIASADRIIQRGDAMWVVGEEENIKNILQNTDSEK